MRALSLLLILSLRLLQPYSTSNKHIDNITNVKQASIGSVVLGGTHQKYDYNTKACPYDAKFIHAGCVAKVAALKNCQVLEEWVGLRPGRKTVRLERDQLVTGLYKSKVFFLHILCYFCQLQHSGFYFFFIFFSLACYLLLTFLLVFYSDFLFLPLVSFRFVLFFYIHILTNVIPKRKSYSQFFFLFSIFFLYFLSFIFYGKNLLTRSLRCVWCVCLGFVHCVHVDGGICAAHSLIHSFTLAFGFLDLAATYDGGNMHSHISTVYMDGTCI